MSKRRIFDIEFPQDGPEPVAETPAAVPAGTETRRGPMAAAISENAGALRERQAAEAAIRAENDRLAHELVRLKKLGLVVDQLPLEAISSKKLTRDRAAARDPELDELKTSIRSIGLSNPIRVEQGEDGYELVQGYRRLAAYRELLEETGDSERYGRIPAGLIGRGETLETLYRRMVDENLVRRDISFAEMAALARSYQQDPETAAATIDEAIAALYGSAGRQKRIYIRNFATLLDQIGGLLSHAHAMPRAVGLALFKRIEKEPDAAAALEYELSAHPDRSEETELELLRRFAAEVAAPVPAKPASRAPGRSAAKTTLRLRRGGEVARCTATDGRIEVKMERDFSGVERHKLEQALTAFFNALDE